VSRRPFIACPVIRKLLDESGLSALLAIVVDGALVSQGRYLGIDELAIWIGEAVNV